ncbi:MAG: cupin domain-containing protein [Deltaproteobacteria bacterium]|nr:cupin domain-containing protein [Deltaproteobacteria bacterium]
MGNMFVKLEKETAIFTPNLHYDCDSRWYFKKGEPSADVSVLRSDFKKGGWADWHDHAGADQAYYVITGTARVWMDNEETFRDIGPGDMVLFPKGHKHKLSNTGDGLLSLVAVNAPAL